MSRSAQLGTPSYVHGDFPCLGIHIARLVGVRRTLSAQQGVDKGGGGLPTCDEAFCTQDAGRGVDVPGEGVDGDDVGRGFVPGTVFPPVGGGDFVPAVVEGVGGGEDTHCE